jgi:hypothetical protein
VLKLLDSIGIVSVTALPGSGSAGEIVYYSGAFYGWTGGAWKSLNNDATTKADVGLSNVDNTSDANKPISSSMQSALNDKQPLDATLTALAALDAGTGLLEQTGADTFTKRNIGAASPTDILTKSGGDSLYAVTGHNHDAAYQALNQRLTDLAALTYSGNGNKFIRVNSGGTAFELAAFASTWANPVTAVGTGSSQDVTLPESNLSPKEVLVFVDGIRWQTSEYTITGTTLTLTTNLAGESIEIIKNSAMASNAASAASNSEIWTGTASTTMTASNIYTSAVEQPLTDAATITINGNLGLNFSVTLAGNRTLANPTNMKSGQSGVVTITQDATGGRTLTYGSNWKFAGGAAAGGVLSTAANAVDLLTYYVRPNGTIIATLTKDFKS